MTPIAWMNALHLEEYRSGKSSGIAWSSAEKSVFYSEPLYAEDAIMTTKKDELIAPLKIAISALEVANPPGGSPTIDSAIRIATDAIAKVEERRGAENLPELLRKASETLAINKKLLETLLMVDTRLQMLGRDAGNGTVYHAVVALREMIEGALK